MSDLVMPACVAEYRKLKTTAERAMAQLTFEQCNVRINPQQNSIAAIVKHMVGNMRSRWTGFLTSDGEKPDRNREDEFHPDYPTREAMTEAWEAGWTCTFAALTPLTDADLGKIVYIRKEPHSVFMAINRQTTHYAGHVAQIALIAKHIKGEGWQYLTIPPGGSAAFNQSKGMK